MLRPYQGSRYANLLQATQLSVSTATHLRLDFFNIYHIVSGCAVNSVPGLNRFKEPNPSSAEVLVVGLGSMGESVAYQIAKRWKRRSGQTPVDKVKVLIIDREARRKKELMVARQPSLVEYCEIVPVELDLLSPAFYRWKPQDNLDVAHLKAVFLFLTEESLNFSVGLRLNQSLHGHGVPIVIRTVHGKGFAHFFKEISARHDEDLRNIKAFPLVSCACCADSLIGVVEVLARGLHDRYLEGRRGDANSASDPAMRPWASLDEEYKEANREQASHIIVTLKGIGYTIVPQVRWDLETVNFSDNEVEKMAEDEHQRWMNERIARGWTLGPRDKEKKTSPYLLPWDDLEEKIKDYDRMFVRDYPALLAAVDLSIIKTTSRTTSLSSWLIKGVRNDSSDGSLKGQYHLHIMFF